MITIISYTDTCTKSLCSLSLCARQNDDFSHFWSILVTFLIPAHRWMLAHGIIKIASESTLKSMCFTFQWCVQRTKSTISWNILSLSILCQIQTPSGRAGEKGKFLFLILFFYHEIFIRIDARERTSHTHNNKYFIFHTFCYAPPG